MLIKLVHGCNWKKASKDKITCFSTQENGRPKSQNFDMPDISIKWYIYVQTHWKTLKLINKYNSVYVNCSKVKLVYAVTQR